ncbi:hypothetical protein Q8A73_022117 [Channa argus]|nr:hypothetical protein Q8A73_022117 [Channa argus]
MTFVQNSSSRGYGAESDQLGRVTSPQGHLFVRVDVFAQTPDRQVGHAHRTARGQQSSSGDDGAAAVRSPPPGRFRVPSERGETREPHNARRLSELLNRITRVQHSAAAPPRICLRGTTQISRRLNHRCIKDAPPVDIHR